MEQLRNWADAAAEKLIKEKGDKASYVCASGISPSGHVHIGNFREIITTAQVVKALRSRGKKVRFIYSWDEFDAFRKVPKDFPPELSKYLGVPLCKIPDPKGCHKSYAEHFEKELEESIACLDLGIEYIYQGKMYQSCKYAEQIKVALTNRKKIREILDKFRKEPLPKDWMPLEVFCEKCWKNNTNILAYDEKYELHYECECGHSNKIDFRKVGNIKLLWRADWAMRWAYEKVDFEPGGKDHSAAGGSFDTGKLISKAIWNYEAPSYVPYEFIGIKGGQAFSSSEGVVLLPAEVLEVYEPDVMTFLFSGTHPSRYFEISFDLDVLKVYEDFDKYERVYFNKEEVSQKEAENMKRAYALACKDIPKDVGEQPTFRHLTTLLQIYECDVNKAIKGIDSSRVKTRAHCALNWLKKYAPDEFKFSVHAKITNEINEHVNKQQKEALKMLRELLEKKKFNEKTLFEEFYKICEATNIKNTEFFEGAYLAIIGKKRGPKLAHFIIAIGQERVAKLLAGLQ